MRARSLAVTNLSDTASAPAPPSTAPPLDDTATTSPGAPIVTVTAIATATETETEIVNDTVEEIAALAARRAMVDVRMPCESLAPLATSATTLPETPPALDTAAEDTLRTTSRASLIAAPRQKASRTGQDTPRLIPSLEPAPVVGSIPLRRLMTAMDDEVAARETTRPRRLMIGMDAVPAVVPAAPLVPTRTIRGLVSDLVPTTGPQNAVVRRRQPREPRLQRLPAQGRLPPGASQCPRLQKPSGGKTPCCKPVPGLPFPPAPRPQCRTEKAEATGWAPREPKSPVLQLALR